jgi:hypothetical protein
MTTEEKLSYLWETKNQIKNAINEKGVTVSDDDTFRSYADKILNIETSSELPTLEGDATESQVLKDKSFYSSDYTKRTGTMTNRGAATLVVNSASGEVAITKGYHNGKGKATTNGWILCPPLDTSLSSSTYSLDNFSWGALKYLCAMHGRAAVYSQFAGQAKTIVVNGQSCTARLVSSNYNGASGLVFYVTGMTTQYALFSGSSTSGGWGNSSFRTTLNSTLYNTLTDDLKNAVQSVTVPYVNCDGGWLTSTIATCTDKLFVPSLRELKGNSNFTYSTSSYTTWQPSEGTQFEYFAEDVSRITPTSNTMTRSVPMSNRYCYLVANSTDASALWLTTATSVGFCFVI